ncbi:cytochrome-c oxidase, cbb3-type subunit III [Sphingomonas sp. HF-S4]|uniref:Cbb3-type cytochrome c oxidase subunit n=1 Tax=Sphingomonas agrestis TaxID=3080540 RepID=A0ABU3Y4I3_9SPHN|nr:cytochrome-c oxidase, cbb3-type subunit III [Sphingomonas sp. HF-S4]MDV3456012.1 cytochrome-c oxidase, cbb3-type subunit III [Sphingomonas sp. HF-S4]
MAEQRIDEKTGTRTVGHEWDGIEELDTPMPRWWLYTFYATIIFALGYVVAYPAWPLVHDATRGVLGWSSRGEYAREVAAEGVRRSAVREELARIPIERLPENSKLFEAAVAGGASAFKVHCVQCHGSGAAGSKGYPNLNDDDWLWGGDLKMLVATITNGIRQPGNDQTHMSLMPAFGRDQLLKPEEIEDIASHVRVLSAQEKPSASAQRGAALFATNCAVCHGTDAKGSRELGAPNLTDGIWLYGGDRESIVQTIANSRGGVMPAWGTRLDPVTIKMLAAYVHSLGGGEAIVPPASPTPNPAQPAPSPTEAAPAPSANGKP